MDADNPIRPKARSAIHNVILDWFSDRARGSVLDAPAGYGHLTMQLSRMGFNVTAGEIEPSIFKFDDVPCIFTDLNRSIEAPDESYDYVCCVDGLEHMTDPYTAVRECSRVLKPGWYGIFSIPNYSNIEKRITFLLKGYLTKPKTEADYTASGSNLFNFHNTPLTITLLDLMFSINQLDIIEILKDKTKKKQTLLLPVVLVMKLLSLFSTKEKRLKKRYDLTLRHDVIFGGNTAIFITKKRDSSL